jgi:hypothetical protein
MQLKYRSCLTALRHLTLMSFCTLSAVSILHAQAAQNSVTADQLAKYDKNRNGVLDPDEVAAMQADQAKAGQTPVASASASSSGQTVELSPFEVDASKDIGYYAENTLSGSRLNTNVGDLASSITVVTKQQLNDTGALNTNDVFLYEANTEGAATYTPLYNNRGQAADQIGGYSSDNGGAVNGIATANRIRGLGSADTAQNNYPTLARLPFDSYNTQSVEINRGPNSMLFGSGGASGIVNNSTAEAVLNQQRTEVAFRFGSFGTLRENFNVNIPLGNKVAIYVAALYDNEQFERKPSSNITRRQYGAITYQPWASTKITADFEHYDNVAHLPNGNAPLDEVSLWLSEGKPGWNPTTQVFTYANGTTSGPFLNSTLDPRYTPALAAQGYLANGTGAFTGSTSAFWIPGITNESHNTIWVNNGQITSAWVSSGGSGAGTNGSAAIPVAASRTAQQWVAQNTFMTITTAAPSPLPPASTGATGYTTWYERAMTNTSIYDYTKYNIAGSNYGNQNAKTYHLEFNQRILPNLNLQLGWFRQELTQWDHYGVGQANQLERIEVDTNTNLMNGAPNPYFGNPFVYDYQADTFYTPQNNNSLRALMAYEYDFTRHQGWTRFLGKHRIVGLASQQKDWSNNVRWRLSFDGGDPRFLPNQNPPVPNNFSWAGSASIERHYYLGTAGNGTVTQGAQPLGEPGFGGPGKVALGYYDWNTTNTWQTTTMSMDDNMFGGGAQDKITSSTSFAYQGNLWSGRVIPLLGTRYDKVRIWSPATGVPTTQEFTNGFGNYAYTTYVSPIPLDSGGDTTTVGGVVRPFANWRWIDEKAEKGNYLWDFVRGLGLSYNHSNNFTAPTSLNTDFFGNTLPKPSGTGQDYGIRGSMFNNRLSWSLNWYDSSAENAISSAASTAIGRAQRIDTSSLYVWANEVVRIRAGQDPTGQFFNNNTVTPLTTAQMQAVNALTEGPNPFLNEYGLTGLGINQTAWRANIIAGTNSLKSKGVEASLIFNPTRNWNIKVTFGQQISTYSNALGQLSTWLYGPGGTTTNPLPGSRLNYWQNLAAPDLPTVYTQNNGNKLYLGSFWNSYGYTGDANSNTTGATSTPQSTYYGIVDSQLYSLITLQNQRTANQREYSSNLITNYAFQQGKLKGFALGGGVRWSSNAVAGYYTSTNPALFTHPTPTQNLISYPDLSKPEYTPALFDVDAWISYSTRIPLLGKSVRAKFQLNGRSITKSGGLTPILFEPNGVAAQYRIIDPRTFFLTSTFDF